MQKTLNEILIEKWGKCYSNPDGTLHMKRDFAELFEAITEWIEQKRPRKQSKNNVWTSTEYEQNIFIDELLGELEN